MRRLDFVRTVAALVAVGVLLLHGGAIAQSARPVSYTHLTLPTTPYV